MSRPLHELPQSGPALQHGQDARSRHRWPLRARDRRRLGEARLRRVRLPFGTAGSRLKDFERGIEIIKDRWSKDPPKPVNGTIPILIGGGGEKVTLRIVAKHADQWHTFGGPEDWIRKSAILDEWCEKVGRDPSTIERTCAARPEHFGVLDEYVKAGARQLDLRLGPPLGHEAA